MADNDVNEQVSQEIVFGTPRKSHKKKFLIVLSSCVMMTSGLMELSSFTKFTPFFKKFVITVSSKFRSA